MSKANANTPITFLRRPADEQSVTIRRGFPEEEAVVRKLSRLDSRAPLEGPWLLAEVAGQPLAAISLASRDVVADPFSHTDDLVELLRARAGHLLASRRIGSRRNVTVFRARSAA